LKEKISKSYGDLTKGATEVGSVALSEAVGKLIEAGGEYGKQFADALSALSVAAKLWKLANLYSYNEFTVVVASNNPTHKPLKGQDNKEAAFTARAGVSDVSGASAMPFPPPSTIWSGGCTPCSRVTALPGPIPVTTR
jgi:hypothetical protein